MRLLAALRPRPALIVPAAVVAAPLVYFVLRDGGLGGRGHLGLDHLLLCVGSLVVGWLAAGGLFTLVNPTDSAVSGWLGRAVVAPTTPTVALFVAAMVGAAGTLVAIATAGLPGVVTTILTPVGFLLGLPLVACYTLVVAVGNAVGREPSLLWQSLAVGLGVALSVLWTAVLSAAVVRTAGLT
jgi:hypothetical protein